jgi:hypothetical protein
VHVSEAGSERTAIDVVYVPYLPLGARIVVGEWELIPRAALSNDDCLDSRVAELSQGLAEVYVLPEGAGTAVGAFARPCEGHIGDQLDDLAEVRDLRRACVVAVLDVNPSPLLREDERDPNAGHWMLTSDNADVVAHGINRELGYTGSITGSRVRRQSLGVAVLDDNPHIPRARITPPSDLRVPTFRAQPLDAEYANATWESIRRGHDAARRLGRAIDWLALVWLNATSLTDELRVPAIHAAFQSLLDSEDAEEVAKQLGPLPGDTSPIRNRTWVSFAGNRRSANLTDVGWWFMEFSVLRNDLMHGRSLGQEKWVHDDRWQTDLGEWYLRDAIKHTVANDGHPDILEELLWRDAYRALRIGRIDAPE